VVTYIGLEAGINVRARVLLLAVQAIDNPKRLFQIKSAGSSIIKAGIPWFYGKMR